VEEKELDIGNILVKIRDIKMISAPRLIPAKVRAGLFFYRKGIGW